MERTLNVVLSLPFRFALLKLNVSLKVSNIEATSTLNWPVACKVRALWHGQDNRSARTRYLAVLCCTAFSSFKNVLCCIDFSVD